MHSWLPLIRAKSSTCACHGGIELMLFPRDVFVKRARDDFSSDADGNSVGWAEAFNNLKKRRCDDFFFFYC